MGMQLWLGRFSKTAGLMIRLLRHIARELHVLKW